MLSQCEGIRLKRTFYELRQLILRELFSGQKTINQLSKSTGINWRTAREHLNFLAARGDVTEVVSSEYVRIFKLTRKGMEKAKPLPANRHASDAIAIEVMVNGSSKRLERVKIG